MRSSVARAIERKRTTTTGAAGTETSDSSLQAVARHGAGFNHLNNCMNRKVCIAPIKKGTNKHGGRGRKRKMSDYYWQGGKRGLLTFWELPSWETCEEEVEEHSSGEKLHPEREERIDSSEPPWELDEELAFWPQRLR